MRRLAFLLALLAPSAAFANCNPFPVLDGGSVSTNFASITNGSSQCEVAVYLTDATGANATPSAAALADATSNPTVISFGSYSLGYNGTTWDRLRTVGTGVLKTDLSSVAGTATDTNSGNKSAGTQRIVIATDQPNLTTALNVNAAQVSGTAVSVNNGAVDAGTTRVTIANNSTGVVGLNAGSAIVGKVGVDQTTPGTTNAVQAIAGTTGGASVCYLSSGASTNATNCKNGAGNVYLYRPINTTTTTYFLRMYNLTTAPTCSSATGYVETIPVPPASVTGGAGGIAVDQVVGEAFSTGIAFCLTGGGSSTDNTNAATGVYVALLYK